VRRLSVTVVMLMLLLVGCAAGADDPPGQGGSSGSGDALLARYDLTGMTAAQSIDRLDALGTADRPSELMASVRVDELRLSDDQGELSLQLPEDRFYLSVAPYVDGTHECFYHSLTTCTGELGGEEVSVSITDDQGTVLVEEDDILFDNGFTGFWLPRDVQGTVRVAYGGRVGSTECATNEDSATCLTTLRLA
jgi:hypothetical protein